MAHPTPRTGKAARILLVMGCVAIVGIGASIITGSIISQRERAGLLSLARTAETAIPVDTLHTLKGSPADLVNPAYLRLKETITRQRGVNDDVRFVYIMGKKPEGTVFFFVDSEPSTSPDYSGPGDEYTDATPELINAFTEGTPFVEGPATDSWGEWVSALVPLRDSQGRIIGMLGMDISTTRLNERVREAQAIPALLSLLVLTLLALYYARTRQNERLEGTRTEFVAIATQQLQAPLISTELCATLLLGEESGALSPQQKDLLGRITDNTQKMKNLVNALTGISRHTPGSGTVDHAHTLDLVALTNDALDTVASTLQERRITLKKNYQATALELRADQEGVRLILDNLISNATKYTPSGGTITVSLSRDPRWMHITVADTGYGIPQQQQKHIFSKLFRADNVRHRDNDGSGLGLYLVKAIVERYGGKVWFASVEHQGSTFYVDLPAR